MFYLNKVLIIRNNKLRKELYVCKADSVIASEGLAVANLTSEDPNVVVTDVNLKNYVNVFLTEDNTGPFYECSISYESSTDDKIIKETYLQQSYSTKQAEEALSVNLNFNYEVKSIKETSIVDYFENID